MNGADLVVRETDTKKQVARIHVSSLSERHVERVISGIMRNMRDDLFIDDSEIEAARAAVKSRAEQKIDNLKTEINDRIDSRIESLKRGNS